MTVRDALSAAAKRLSEAGIETPWLDVWVILADILETDREHLFAAYADSIDPAARRRLETAVERRVAGEPVSYIIGRKEFFGLTFAVDPRVLVPRPDTEALVEAVLALVDDEPWIERIHDCCTGSGCIAVTLAHERPGLEVSASDVSREALDVAALNSRRILGRRLPLYESNFLASVPGTYHVITANAPYVSASEYGTMASARWPEPRIALEAGADGLSAYRSLIPESVDSLCKGGYLFVEAADTQSESIRHLMRDNGYEDVRTVTDLAGRRRVSWGRRSQVWERL